MKATLTVHQNGKQLQGNDFVRVVKSPTPRKIKIEQNNLNTHLQRLVKIKPSLSSGWIIKIEK